MEVEQKYLSKISASWYFWKKKEQIWEQIDFFFQRKNYNCEIPWLVKIQEL